MAEIRATGWSLNGVEDAADHDSVDFHRFGFAEVLLFHTYFGARFRERGQVFVP